VISRIAYRPGIRRSATSAERFLAIDTGKFHYTSDASVEGNRRLDEQRSFRWGGANTTVTLPPTGDSRPTTLSAGLILGSITGVALWVASNDVGLTNRRFQSSPPARAGLRVQALASSAVWSRR